MRPTLAIQPAGYTVRGLGSTTCQTWLQTGSRPANQWILGFVSGAEAVRHPGIVSGDSTDIPDDTIMEGIQAYCPRASRRSRGGRCRGRRQDAGSFHSTCRQVTDR
jgi:hypothetical protein